MAEHASTLLATSDHTPAMVSELSEASQSEAVHAMHRSTELVLSVCPEPSLSKKLEVVAG